MKDIISRDRVAQLHVCMRERITRFIEAIESMGLRPRISQGLRTIQEQNDLYALGRTKNGNIVTNAKGGESWHNFGLAIDLCFINQDGSIDFNVPERVGSIAKEFKLEWGAKWSFPDKPHFQLEGLPSNPKQWSTEKLDRHLAKYIEKNEAVISPWALNSVEKARKKGIITNWSAPQEAVSDETYQWVFHKLGALEKITTVALNRERLAVVLDRLHLLD